MFSRRFASVSVVPALALMVLTGCDAGVDSPPAGHAQHSASNAAAVHVDVTPRVLGSGTEQSLSIGWRFTNSDGSPTALERVHEKPLHAIIVAKDLSWFAHEHPAAVNDDTYELRIKPPAGGDYILFSQFKGEGATEQVERTVIAFPGDAPPAKPLTPDDATPKIVDGYTVSLAADADAGGTARMLRYTILRDGRPVTDLQPYLAALGHAVAISSDSQHFVHVHPMEGGEQSGNVEFHAEFPAPGTYATWFQFQHEGGVVTVPFTLRVDAAGASTPANHDAAHSHH